MRRGSKSPWLQESDSKLLGTITDGDVRRALLRSEGMGCSVASVMSQSPLVVTPEMPREMVLLLMRANRIHQLPVVDGGRHVVGLHIWDDIVAPSSRKKHHAHYGRGIRQAFTPIHR